MAVQTKVVRLFMAGAVAIALSGCVSVPDAIKGSSPTPQQDLVRVMNAPELYVGQEARFGGKVVEVLNQQGKPVWRSPPYRWIAARGQYWVRRLAGAFTRMSAGSSIRSIFAVSWSLSLDLLPERYKAKSAIRRTNS